MYHGFTGRSPDSEFVSIIEDKFHTVAGAVQAFNLFPDYPSILIHTTKCRHLKGRENNSR
jgi:hypothetical protein